MCSDWIESFIQGYLVFENSRNTKFIIIFLKELMNCSKYIRFPSYCTKLYFNAFKQDISSYKLKPNFKENDYSADLVQTTLKSTLYVPQHRFKQNKIVLCVEIFQNNLFHLPLVLKFFLCYSNLQQVQCVFQWKNTYKSYLLVLTFGALLWAPSFVFMSNQICKMEFSFICFLFLYFTYFWR